MARKRHTTQRRGLTPEQRRERLDHARQQLHDAVEDLTSSHGWHTMLTARAWLRRYSTNNLLMILTQYPQASDVRPLREWNEAGRRVRKGATAIRIFAPCRYRLALNDEDTEEEPRYQVRGFTLVSVFDVTQTDGTELGQPAPVVPEELRGAAPAALWDQVAALIAEQGYAIERGDCASAYGWVDFTTRTVRVRAEVEAAQAVKTLTHELAHIWCAHDTHDGLTRPRKEVEAESVACLTATVMGLDTLSYSVPYVAHWAQDAQTAHASAERVMAAADEITAALQHRARHATAPT